VRRSRHTPRRRNWRGVPTPIIAQLVAQAEEVRRATDTPILIAGIVSLALGLLILVRPPLLNYIVAAYLIIVGVLWIVAALD
jgi:uncharacterized membrane protein HdeD (DUF308 family)